MLIRSESMGKNQKHSRMVIQKKVPTITKGPQVVMVHSQNLIRGWIQPVLTIPSAIREHQIIQIIKCMVHLNQHVGVIK